MKGTTNQTVCYYDKQITYKNSQTAFKGIEFGTEGDSAIGS